MYEKKILSKKILGFANFRGCAMARKPMSLSSFLVHLIWPSFVLLLLYAFHLEVATSSHTITTTTTRIIKPPCCKTILKMYTYLQNMPEAKRPVAFNAKFSLYGPDVRIREVLTLNKRNKNAEGRKSQIFAHQMGRKVLIQGQITYSVFFTFKHQAPIVDLISKL